MVTKILNPDSWNKLRSDQYIVLDARSPGEYNAGHIPGALNLPLLNDEQRHIVGITYKKAGQKEAVKKGFELTGHEFSDKITRANELSNGRPILLYCWRGGLRSNILGWILSTAGLEINLLEGGYKAWRNNTIAEFSKPRKILVISGKTGTGKTELLHLLASRGEHIIDIESLCHHKGSSFGALGQPEQPTQEQFENIAGEVLSQIPEGTTLWIEDESRFLGRLRIPDAFFSQMSSSPLIVVDRPVEIRAQRILKEYGHFPIELLSERTMALSKRMGSEQASMASELLMSGDKSGWVMQLLRYYDKAYEHSTAQNEHVSRRQINFSHEDESAIAEELIQLRRKDYE
ncbi:MAG: hypothetical protein RL220_367 [Bacteroidota bacterium]